MLCHFLVLALIKDNQSDDSSRTIIIIKSVVVPNLSDYNWFIVLFNLQDYEATSVCY